MNLKRASLILLAAMFLPGLAFAQDVIARFETSMVFTDANPVATSVVHRECNAGLPLNQFFEMGDDDFVEFIATLLPGEVELFYCTITAADVPNYTTWYSELGVDYDLEPCDYTGLELDALDWTAECHIRMVPDTATFDVTKIWDGGEVAVQLTCGDVEVDSATTSGLAATLTVTDFADLTDCTVTETVPAGFAPSYSADCDVTDILSCSVYSCEITNAATVARFQVTKDFSDGSTDDVEVTLTCNTGLPLEQSLTITGGDDFGVIFVVTDYIDGTMSCAVTEVTNTPGYDMDTSGCVWDDVMTSDSPFSCVVNNTAQDGTFTVNKVWNIFNEDVGSEVYEQAHVELWCDAVITNGGYYDDYSGNWYLYDYLGDGESLTAKVSTLTGTANCWAYEHIYQSGVESSGDCGSRPIVAGGSSSCTFTNTVFFEGIPTLSQYGLVLMALLMLGMGFVGFRRFV